MFVEVHNSDECQADRRSGWAVCVCVVERKHTSRQLGVCCSAACDGEKQMHCSCYDGADASAAGRIGTCCVRVCRRVVCIAAVAARSSCVRWGCAAVSRGRHGGWLVKWLCASPHTLQKAPEPPALSLFLLFLCCCWLLTDRLIGPQHSCFFQQTPGCLSHHITSRPVRFAASRARKRHPIISSSCPAGTCRLRYWGALISLLSCLSAA